MYCDFLAILHWWHGTLFCCNHIIDQICVRIRNVIICTYASIVTDKIICECCCRLIGPIIEFLQRNVKLTRIILVLFLAAPEWVRETRHNARTTVHMISLQSPNQTWVVCATCTPSSSIARCGCNRAFQLRNRDIHRNLFCIDCSDNICVPQLKS